MKLLEKFGKLILLYFNIIDVHHESGTIGGTAYTIGLAVIFVNGRYFAFALRKIELFGDFFFLQNGQKHQLY